MADALIENPTLNSPFHEPDRHFKFTDEGITNEIVEGRRTSSYFTEVAKKFGDAWIENDIRAANDTSNPGLSRLALKMATGSGKTVVMAMLVAWQALNKLANPQDARFSDTFLIISPGITIRDRLRVLLPNDPNIEFAHAAADRIYGAIVRGSNGSPDGPPSLRPILRPDDTVGSTRYVDFDATRPVYATKADRCHVSHAVADTDSWEQKVAQTLEDMDEVIRYVKNLNLGFTIPYTINGEEHQYHPDFLAVLDDGRGVLDPLNLIVEVTGEKKKEKAAKVMTARTLWVPAVNNHGAFGRWGFIEIADPWDAESTIRGTIPACEITELRDLSTEGTEVHGKGKLRPRRV